MQTPTEADQHSATQPPTPSLEHCGIVEWKAPSSSRTIDDGGQPLTTEEELVCPGAPRIPFPESPVLASPSPSSFGFLNSFTNGDTYKHLAYGGELDRSEMVQQQRPLFGLFAEEISEDSHDTDASSQRSSAEPVPDDSTSECARDTKGACLAERQSS
ncbi:SubName: Full=Uncharacterized protein {ECO:0000313/EMBL:CCA67543.1} [Serendipita indica DSM 11827]|uniref:Uncharacterized protein n=1 Tax=Serendipita indica (strain DSM 11827) TaxID=1109443 RepID=G4T880_SERID|nr:SubName: Full=Uncharacterized protein {ECO:0000313/EMBL:CCA67543.1} [Serendipita indica DSM 11827]CCA67543.1 hypothetical protein PIIN_01372 [Serendipita indica DSM 11827]